VAEYASVLRERVDVTRRPLVAALRRVATVALACAGVLAAPVVLFVAWRRSELAVDFHHELYVQARELLRSGVPFDPPDVVIDGSNRIFPPLATMLAVPFTLLPSTAADVAVSLLLVLAAAGTLRLLGVRDWRVYAIVALWPPFVSGLQTANLTILVGLLAAVAWRYRGRALVAGAAVGLAMGLKLFPWPLVAWLVATRRYRAALTAVTVCLVSIVVVWPLASPLDYVHLVARLGDVMDERGYTLFAALGADGPARAVWLAVAAAVVVVAHLHGDRRSFTLAVTACLLCTPIVWLHYFALLAVPLAVARPRLSWPWLAPLALWVVPVTDPSTAEVALALTVTAAVTIGALRAPAPRAATAAEPLRSVEAGTP
jgi:alpha-1,2-mannosyltransferase